MHEDYIGLKLCIFIGESDKYDGRNLYELLLGIALESGLSGGTVTRGREGSGTHGEIHPTQTGNMADNLPIIIEFMGRIEKIDGYVERVQPMIKNGLLTRTEVRITQFRSPEDLEEDLPALSAQKNEDQEYDSAEEEIQADEPIVEAPEPVAEEPEPRVEAPEPVAEEPEPVVEEPEPVSEEPEPVSEAPEPILEEPAPTIEDFSLSEEETTPPAPAPHAQDLKPDIDDIGPETPASQDHERIETQAPEVPEFESMNLQVIDEDPANTDEKPDLDSFNLHDIDGVPDPAVSVEPDPTPKDEGDYGSAILRMLKKARGSHPEEPESETKNLEAPELDNPFDGAMNEHNNPEQEAPEKRDSVLFDKQEPVIDIRKTREQTKASEDEEDLDEDGKPKMYDQGHTMEDMKNYFSSIINDDDDD